MLSVAEVKNELGVSDETVRRYIKTGKLRGFQLPGGHWKVYPGSLHELIQNGEPDPGVIDPHASRSRLVAVQGSLRERERVA